MLVRNAKSIQKALWDCAGFELALLCLQQEDVFACSDAADKMYSGVSILEAVERSRPDLCLHRCERSVACRRRFSCALSPTTPAGLAFCSFLSAPRLNSAIDVTTQMQCSAW